MNRLGKISLPLIGMTGTIGLMGLLTILAQDAVSGGEAKTVIGIGIGGSAALLFLLQRAFTHTGQIGEIRGELKALKEFSTINRTNIDGLQRDAAGVEARLTLVRHDTVDALTPKIAEIQLELGTRMDNVEEIVRRISGDPTESPAGRALKAELDAIRGRLDNLEPVRRQR